MRRIGLILLIAASLFTSCTVVEPVKKSVAYKGMYAERPLTILLMPPINRSTNVEAKEYFHATLSVPLANKGFYVLPPFLSMELLKKESAYDAELFLNEPLHKFGEYFGADAVLFTIIHSWEKTYGYVTVEIEYIIKSTETNEISYMRRGRVVYDTTFNSNQPGLASALVSIALTAINTAATKYIDLARDCNTYALQDLPSGNYSPNFIIDGEEIAGAPNFVVTLKKGGTIQ
jgi:hypothetical protein